MDKGKIPALILLTALATQVVVMAAEDPAAA